MIKVINDIKEFDEFTKDGNVLVDFYADWCGPCKMLMPVIETLSKEDAYQDLKIVEINVDLAQDIARRYQIQVIPTLLHIKDGKLLKVTQGYHTLNDLKSFLNKH